jgi:uncharacterized protein (DUF305 family)
MNTRFRFGALAAAATLIFTAAACGTTTTPAASSPAVSTTPSAGGSISMSTDSSMSPATSSGGMSMSAASTGQHNDADVTFAQMMIEHHRGAIEMADLAPTRAASDEVKQLAAKIKAAQAPEIKQMSGWLTAWGAGPAASSSSAMGSMSGMDHGSSTATAMPGMMSGEQMTQLTAATGAAFDKMFLQLMIAHHQGALKMAKTEKTSGQNPDALALADSIISSQTAEIATMQNLLKGM